MALIQGGSMEALSLVLVLLLSTPIAALAHGNNKLTKLNYVHLPAKDKYERTKIIDLGVSIEAVRSDSIYGLAPDAILKKLKENKIQILESFPITSRFFTQDFPQEDERFHNYSELTTKLEALAQAHPNLIKLSSIGKTIQDRDIWCLQFNSSKETTIDNKTTFSAKPGIVFMGNHHAREHVSAEIPLMLAQHLAQLYGTDAAITELLDARDVYIIPMVNPDGVEHDIATGSYKYHRKNMRENSTDFDFFGSIGVDLNRNYGFGWGGSGSSNNPSSDIYRGPQAFSEPETQAIKTFIEARPNIKILLSYHTFSELILYPWGHQYEAITKQDDLDAFKAMANKMAQWNHYTPQQSAELYLASGDTTDWAYGEHGIFAFTFELSPKDMWGGGGFYPGAGVLDKVFEDNIKPAIYLIELSDNPYRAKEENLSPILGWLN